MLDHLADLNPYTPWLIAALCLIALIAAPLVWRVWRRAVAEEDAQIDDAVLRAAILMDGTGYGVTLRDTVCRDLGYMISYGELYASLDRLSETGAVTFTEGGATIERGNRPKRFVHVPGVTK